VAELNRDRQNALFCPASDKLAITLRPKAELCVKAHSMLFAASFAIMDFHRPSVSGSPELKSFHGILQLNITLKHPPPSIDKEHRDYCCNHDNQYNR